MCSFLKFLENKYEEEKISCISTTDVIFASKLFLRIYRYMLCLVSQSCLTLSCQAPLSLGILQARILEWVATTSSRRSSQPRD